VIKTLQLIAHFSLSLPPLDRMRLDQPIPFYGLPRSQAKRRSKMFAKFGKVKYAENIGLTSMGD
jgi:hypothetical protein